MSQMPLGEDASLLAAVATRRDRQAFERLYEIHHRLVFGLACRMLGDPGEAEDLLQAVFLYAWERAGTYDPARGSAGAWFCVVTRSRCLDRLRSRSRRRSRELPLEQELLEILAQAPAAEENGYLRSRALRGALDTLPEAQRRVIEGLFFEGKTQAEIAADQRLPLGTVKGRLRLGMAKLAKSLAAGKP